MPRYILKTLDSTSKGSKGGNRSFEKNLMSLSTLGMKWDTGIIKNMRTDAVNNAFSDESYMGGSSWANMMGMDPLSRAYENVAGNNDFIAYYDQSYKMRRDFLRKFALQSEINYIVETIADDVIVNDDMHYFAYPSTRKMKNILTKDKGKKVVDEINAAYARVYQMFHFNESNDAWHYVKKFLVDGFLAFEIIFSSGNDGKTAKDIVGFKELDATTMVPQIRIGPDGKEYKVWVVNKGDKQNERELLDTNVIYISWAKTNFISHYSYCERLIRSFNMLRTLENSRIIWNVQNAQKRIKIVVPIGTESDQVAKTRLRQLEAYYKEDINIDNMSGEITVNGQPKFSFAKTMVFPSKEGVSTEISELGVEGHDMNSTESLKWFWQRFIIESRLPKDRFNMFFDGSEVSAIPDNSNMTREEYRYSLFVGRIRDLWKEVVIKPTWIQFCLHNPDWAVNNTLKNALGLEFVEENVFRLSKESANLNAGVELITRLSGLNKSDGSPAFSTRFLMQKYLNFSDEDWDLNEKMLNEEMKSSEAANAQNAGDGGFGGESGGFGGLGGFEEPSAGGGLGEMPMAETPSEMGTPQETPEMGAPAGGEEVTF